MDRARAVAPTALINIDQQATAGLVLLTHTQRRVRCLLGFGASFRRLPRLPLASAGRCYAESYLAQVIRVEMTMVSGIGCMTVKEHSVASKSHQVRNRKASVPDVSKSDSAEVPCAFCKGTGTDIFGIMSWESKCCVCKGKGTATVHGPQEKCAHCRGTGAIDRQTCTACSGKGLVPKREGKTVACPECQGTGDVFSDASIPCSRCGGHGWILADAANP